MTKGEIVELVLLGGLTILALAFLTASLILGNLAGVGLSFVILVSSFQACVHLIRLNGD